MELQKIRNKKLAFTLVELIIVIVILGILGTIGFISFKGYIKDARDSTRLMTIKNIQTGLDSYKIGSGKYPNPEELYGSGNISGVELVKVGKIGDGITRLLKINTIPKDPLSNSNYTYGVTSDNLMYQIGGIFEGNEVSYGFVDRAYADDYKAKVIGNYPSLLSYKIGTDTYYGNFPSILFSNTGSTNMLSSGTYYIVDKKGNLPYTKEGKIDISIQKLDGNKMINEITKDTTTSLTGIKTTGMTPDTISNYFTGEILKSFSVNGQTPTLTFQRLSALISGNNKGKTIEVNNQGCLGTSSGSYVIPNLTNIQSTLLSRGIQNGTGSLTVTCNNGSLIYGNETFSCITNYVVNNGSCVQDICQGSAPLNSQTNATSQSYGSSWSHNSTPGVCTFVCQAGYYYSSGNCVAASVGNYVSTSGLTSQTACSSGTYQNLTGQTSCISANAGYYVPSTGLTNQTACSTGYYQASTGQSSCSACTNKVTNSSYTASSALTTNTCPYSCDSGYYSSGGSCLSFVNGSCSGIVSNAQYYNGTASYTLSGATNGTSLTANYSATTASNTCQFKCNSGFTWNGSSCAANSTTCSTLKSAGNNTDGVYTLTSGGNSYSSFCDMTNNGGGWTLVMRMDSDSTFNYSSSYWTNTTLLNQANTSNSFTTNAKFEGYNSIVGNSIMFCKNYKDGCIVYNGNFNSTALQLFSSGSIALSLDRNTFISNFGNAYQNCNQGGINAGHGMFGLGTQYQRFGMFFNNENDCGSCDDISGWGNPGCGVGMYSNQYGMQSGGCVRGTIYIK